MLDLLVIGAGLTGLSAALRAAEAGLRVKVIAKGMGSVHWSAATIDLLGYVPGRMIPVRTPWESIPSLPGRHPYRLLDAQTARSALERFQTWSVELGLHYSGGAVSNDNFMLPSPVGAMRPVYLAPRHQRAGDLSLEQPILLIGFEGMRDFYPRLLADNLSAQGQQVRTMTLPFELLSERRDINTVQLATALDEPARHGRLAEAVSAAARSGERIGFPAILGLRRHQQTLETLQQATNAPIFEIPTLPPSVPGIRLTSGLRKLLAARGVRVEVGMETIGFHAEDREIRWVETSTSARPLRHRARRYLLATGGVLGGGFNSDHTGRFWEVVFDLPLTVPQGRGQLVPSPFPRSRRPACIPGWYCRQ